MVALTSSECEEF